MTYGRVCAAGPNNARDGAAVSHLAELVRGEYSSSRLLRLSRSAAEVVTAKLRSISTC